MVGFLASLAVAAATVGPAFAAPHDRRPTPSISNITQMSFGDLETRALSGPQLGKNFPDPSLIYGDGSWKAYSTSSEGKEVPIAVSDDAFNWRTSSEDALPNPGSWVDPNDRSIWAPDVNKNDDGVYVMYYTARRNGGNHCIGAATSRSAKGPFQPQDQPLVCDDANGGVIDPAGYDDGRDRWLLWKVDGNSRGGATTCQGGPPTGDYYYPTPIKIQRLARDALTLLDQPKVILDHEGRNNDGIVEAPTLYKVPGGDFVLFYSAHCYASDDYDVEYAWSSTVDGRYDDRGVLFRTADNIGIFGPGHPDIDPNGRNMVFHGRTGANQGGGGTRVLYSATLNFNGRRITY